MNSKTFFRPFLVISFLIALADVSFVYINNRFSDSSFDHYMDTESESLKEHFDTLLHQTYASMLSIATYISNDPEVQSLFLSGKKAVELEGGGRGALEADKYRKALFEKLSTNWSAVQNEFSARQLHFHLGPGSTSFLRVHKPSKYGDNMDDVRFTIVDTNLEKKSRAGFETGRVYSGLRGVVPVTALDSETNNFIHVGALEVGTSFEVLLDIIDKTSDFGAGVLLTKKHIEETMWKEAIPARFTRSPQKCDCFIEASSREGFDSIISASKEKGVRFRDGGQSRVFIDGEHYLVSYFPLRDYLGEMDHLRDDVGAVVFWKNISSEVAALEYSQNYNIAIGVLGFLFVELIVFIGFKLGTAHLRAVIADDSKELHILKNRLNDAQAIAHIGNWEWDISSQKLWWSDEIYRISGMNPGSEPPSYETFLELVHPDDRSKVESSFESALEGDMPFVVEHRIKQVCGAEKIVEERGKVVRDSSGRAVKLVGTAQDITQAKQAADVIQSREKLYRQMFDLNTAIKLLVDPVSGNIVRANESACEFYGFSSDQMEKKSIYDLNMLTREEVNLEIALASSERRRFFRFKHKIASGEIRDVEINTGPIDVGNKVYLYSVITDVTDRNRYEKSLKAKNEKLKRAASVFSHAQEGIIITDSGGTIVETNKAFHDITGYTESEVIGQNPRVLKSGKHTESFYQSMWSELIEKRNWQGEVWNKSKNGHFFAERLTITAVEDDNGNVLNYVGVFADITLQKEKELELEKNANYDSLTSLPNRRYFETGLDHKLSVSKPRNCFGLLYIDLDGFKSVNDSFGHLIGDDLLKAVAERFATIIRPEDILSRVGGDEFLVLLNSVSDENEITHIASRFIHSASTPFDLGGNVMSVSASIGGLLVQGDENQSAEILVEKADSLMYRAKNNGKNQFVTGLAAEADSIG